VQAARDLLVTLVYLLPVALLALLLVREKWRPRWLMVSVLAALPLFYIAHYHLMGALQGWPSDATLPEEFQLLAFRIAEPDPQNADRGQILIWAMADGQPQPRVYRLAYGKGLHQSLVRAGQRQAEGRPQVGRQRPAQAAARPGQQGERAPQIVFDDEQPATLPAKPTDS
jgi:hypothetical protein